MSRNKYVEHLEALESVLKNLTDEEIIELVDGVICLELSQFARLERLVVKTRFGVASEQEN